MLRTALCVCHNKGNLLRCSSLANVECPKIDNYWNKMKRWQRQNIDAAQRQWIATILIGVRILKCCYECAKCIHKTRKTLYVSTIPTKCDRQLLFIAEIRDSPLHARLVHALCFCLCAFFFRSLHSISLIRLSQFLAFSYFLEFHLC